MSYGDYIAIEQEKQERAMNRLMKIEPPMILEEELAQFRKAAAENATVSFAGRILKFKKGQWWLGFGSEKEMIADRTHWVALMADAQFGWRKFETVVDENGNTKKRPVYKIGKISQGFRAPERETLGDNDKSQWPIGLNKEPEDPWKKVGCLPLVSPDFETTLATFITDTNTGLTRFWKFIGRYAWLSERRPGQYPIVETRASGYNDKCWDWVDVPEIEITTWVSRPDLARIADAGSPKQIEHKADEPDLPPAPEPPPDYYQDEVPF